jgi:hypothetical protein
MSATSHRARAVPEDVRALLRGDRTPLSRLSDCDSSLAQDIEAELIEIGPTQVQPQPQPQLSSSNGGGSPSPSLLQEELCPLAPSPTELIQLHPPSPRRGVTLHDQSEEEDLRQTNLMSLINYGGAQIDVLLPYLTEGDLQAVVASIEACEASGEL